MTPVDTLALAPAAFLAGVLMFLAPCTLPIVPGYLAFIAGAGALPAGRQASRRRLLLNAISFVVGFSIIFVLLGSFAGFLGGVVGPWRDAFGRAAGILIVLFGLTMLGFVRISIVTQERRFHIPHVLALGRPESSLLIGVLFALGWSPCIGPILGTILLFASTQSSALQGAVLLGIFSLGLGLPFIVTALALERASAFFVKWSGVTHTLSVVGGVVLVVLGVLMFLGRMGLLVTWGFDLFNGHYSTLLQYM